MFGKQRICASAQINYANISEQVKFIDMMKYYQQSLAKLEESMTDEEKEKIKKESKKFSLKHNYFGKVFPMTKNVKSISIK